MSNQAINWAYKQPVKISGEKFVLVAVADFADESGSCFPSQDRLAEMTGQSVSSVNRHLKNLEAVGYLTRKHRYDEFGKRTSDRFYLALTTSHGATKDAGGESLHRNMVPTTSHGGADYIAPCESIPQEPLVEPSTKDLSSNFDAFWVIYPRKDAKRSAEKAWMKAAARASPETIRAGARRYADDWNRQPEFTKLPATWLNGDCWDDSPLPARNGHGPSPSDQRAEQNLALVRQYAEQERQAIQ